MGKAGLTGIETNIMILFHWLNLILSTLASVFRFGAGAGAPAADIKKPLILYEFEGCPYCRFAREAVSESGVPVLVRPCPKGGKRFRPSVKTLGGKTQFPFLVDPNADVAFYESADIAAYLSRTYGGRRAFLRFLGPLNFILSEFSVFVRAFAGTFASPSRAPEKPLEFIGAERDPRARLVKELLCEMELEYLWRPAAADECAPLLIDPNTGEKRVGARAIRKYLGDNYRS